MLRSIVQGIQRRYLGMSTSAVHKPLVAIVGATGTGKSELAVTLAQRFDGEIINGDAMQLYDGLPIITNKISIEDRKGIPHHLLGVVGQEEEPWQVGRFTRTALDVIEDIRNRGRLPILVGGTHYYTQSLLFQDSLADDMEDPNSVNLSEEEKILRWPILGKSTADILAKLKEVDPVMADRWHPNDRRKLQRSLEIWLKTGRLASDVYEEQSNRKSARLIASDGKLGDAVGTGHLEVGDTKTAGQQPFLRFPTLVLWIHAAPDVLSARLDQRVEKMVCEGLISEVESLDQFLQSHEAGGRTIDKTRGIWVSIGYKEFEPYVSARKTCSRSKKDIETMRQGAIEQTKAATRQYAKRQVRWIRIKLINAMSAAASTDHLFLLDGSSIADWSKSVAQPANELLEAFLGCTTLPLPVSLSTAAGEMLSPARAYDVSERRDLWVRRTCDMCGITAVMEEQWISHLKSKKHRTATKRSARAQVRESMATNSG